MYEDYLHGVNAIAAKPDAFPDAQQHAELLKVLSDIHRLCSLTNLVVSASTVERTIKEFQTRAPRFRESQQKLAEWFSCFTSELETQMFLLVLPHEVPYHPMTKGGWGEALLDTVAAFPDARYDAFQAGACFAFGCFTACVYHLMRVAEYGLVSVATSLNVDQEKLAKGWDGCIQGIESAIKTISSTKPTTDWQAQVKKYSDLCAWFTTIKTGWRNPASHIPRNYSEQSAAGMFSATRTLFEHLWKYEFKPTTMPRDPLSLPEA
jgi:hypothetical protein